MSTLYIYLFTCMHVYCMPRGVKRSDIVKEILMFVCGHWNKDFGEWSQLYTLDVTNLNSIFFLWNYLTYKCFVRTAFILYVQIICNLNSVFDLVPQYNGLFSGYIMYIVRCDCHTAINLKHPKFLGIAYPL